jgi:predicted metal-binding membrane protein
VVEAGARRTTLGVAAAALLALVAVGTSPYARYFHHDYQPASGAGQAGAILLFMAGWALMMLAMMLPNAGALLTAAGRLAIDERAARRIQLFAASGFIGAWLAVGYVFRAGDVLVHAGVDTFGWLQARPQLVAASALFVAGAFQFVPLKHRCLTACRSPSGFLYRHWHGEEPVRDALRIGAAYGVSCVGCCWALMLVMFGLGTADVAWMFGIGTIMAVEKNARIGPRLSGPIGVCLLLAAVWVAA